MKIRSYIFAAVVGAALALAPAAGAHVTLQPEEAPAGGFARLDVRVPNERDNAGTTKVEVQFPPGFLFASYEPAAGWDIEVTRRKLDKPVEQFGEQITEEIDRVIFTAQGKGNAIQPGQFRDFGLSLSIPDKPGSTVAFKALQTYSNGEVVRWIGPPDAEEPAPQVKLASAEAEEASAPAAEQPATPAAAEEGDDDGNGLAIAALVVAIAALAAGLAALFLRRGRTRVGAA